MGLDAQHWFVVGVTMLRATSLIRKAAVKDGQVTDTAWLDHRARGGAQGALRTHAGLEIQLELERAAPLGDGDAVKLEDGRLVRIRAAPERLLEVRAENPLRLLRFAWHIGQEHVPAEFKADAIYVEANGGVAELARGQGCVVADVTRPFQPERVIEHSCEHHDHDHHHGHDHHHDHGHDHGEHEHDRRGAHGEHGGHDHHGHNHGHDHDEHCGHGHHAKAHAHGDAGHGDKHGR
jgi:urease accessory protein